MSEFYVYSDDEITVIQEETLDSMINNINKKEIKNPLKLPAAAHIGKDAFVGTKAAPAKTEPDNFEKPNAYKNINNK